MHGMTSAMYEGSSNFCLEETNRLKTNFVERKLHLRNGYDHIDLQQMMKQKITFKKWLYDHIDFYCIVDDEA